jgi:molybdopterin-guanine dinucleotide biosynthesis protein A
MGRDKATLAVDGRPMAMRVAQALRDAGAREVVAVGGDPAPLEAMGLAVVGDDEPGDGPFPATLTALRRTMEDIVLVLSCDLLAPDPRAIRSLAAHLHSAAPAVLGVVPIVGGEPQWTHAAWRRTALEPLASARRTGVRSLRRAAAALPVVLLEGLPAAALADADEPRDLPGDG